MLDRGRMLFAYGVFYPEGGGTTFEAKHIVFVGRTRARLRLRAPGLVGRPDPRDRRLLHPTPSSPTATSTSPQYRTQISLEGEKLPGTRQETDTISRMVYGFATRVPADRRGPLPRGGREGHRVPARALAHRRRRRGHRLLVPRHRHRRRRRRRRSSPPSSATTTTRSRPTSRSTRSPARPRPSASPATRGSESDIDMTIELFNRFYLDRDGRRLLLAPRPDHVRPAQRVARPQPGAQELELGRRPRPGVPDQRCTSRPASDAVRRLPRIDTANTIVQPLPRLREQPVRAGALPRGLDARPRRGAGSTTAPSSATT